MNKVVYLNSHLEKFRKEPEIKIKLEDLEGLSRYPNLLERDKKTTKIFVKCFKNKETYSEFLKKIPDNVDRLGRFYLITVYWIAYTNYYHSDKFDEEMGICLERIDQNIILLDSPHFCKKVYHYLVKPELLISYE